MKKLLFATSNDDKVREANLAVKPFGLQLEHARVDVDEIKDLDIFKVAERKALDTYEQLQKPVVVEDTGIFFEQFKGFPGTYSKFAIMTLGVANTVKVLEGHSKKAYFSTVACYADGKQTKCFEGKTPGEVVLQARGSSPAKLPYDSYFIPAGKAQTYAEMGVVAKDALSHRAGAFRKFAAWYCKK